ncbi:hypothetical protein ACQKKK_08595 [Peribacillus sp. NPDC006672]|uniref:hypothetical protein n=1 Tax=Peribacillus sp. NPDC006672 TaxID=3390606 RepID=UPI003D032040
MLENSDEVSSSSLEEWKEFLDITDEDYIEKAVLHMMKKGSLFTPRPMTSVPLILQSHMML